MAGHKKQSHKTLSAAPVCVGPESGQTMSGNCKFSNSVRGRICFTSLSYVIILIHAVSKAYGSKRREAIISANPTFTDSIGSPCIEPDVSISIYTGNLLLIFSYLIRMMPVLLDIIRTVKTLIPRCSPLEEVVVIHSLLSLLLLSLQQICYLY